MAVSSPAQTKVSPPGTARIRSARPASVPRYQAGRYQRRHHQRCQISQPTTSRTTVFNPDPQSTSDATAPRGTIVERSPRPSGRSVCCWVRRGLDDRPRQIAAERNFENGLAPMRLAGDITPGLQWRFRPGLIRHDAGTAATNSGAEFSADLPPPAPRLAGGSRGRCCGNMETLRHIRPPLDALSPDLARRSELNSLRKSAADTRLNRDCAVTWYGMTGTPACPVTLLPR